MANQRDQNRVPNIAGVSSITYTGSIEPAVNPVTHELLVSATAVGLGLAPYDYMSRSIAGDGVTVTYTFKSGGSSGTITNTLVIVYTSASLDTISSLTKT